MMALMCVRVVLAAAVTALVGASCGAGSTAARLRGDILIKADRVYDGRTFVEPGAVLVRGGQIVAAGSSLDARARKAFDLGDATILPGVVDLHVHGAAGETARRGVTTVRNLGAPLASLQPPRRVLGIRILMAGPLVTVPNGYPTPVFGSAIALDVQGVASARRAVRLLARRGATVIKIALEPGGGDWPMLSVAEVRSIVAEAHAVGLDVTAHAMGSSGTETAAAGGVDELAHVPCGASDATLRTLVARGVPVVATLHVVQIFRGGCQDVAERFVKLGGRLLYGTDFGNRGIPAGVDVTELRLMRQVGLTPTETLAAATSAAAKEAGLAPLGTLTPGAPADVIAVRGDARKLRSDLARPLLVVSGGRVVVDRVP
jgi:imidazolonepropionase-like amidohydrolase